MRRRLVSHVLQGWRHRSLGGVRRSHEYLEKHHNLKQTHELPTDGRPTPWKDEFTWKDFAFIAVTGTGIIGVVVYEVGRARKRDPTAKQILDVHKFLPFTLTAKEEVAPNCSIFTLLPNKQLRSIGDPYERLWRSSIWSVEAKQPQLQIARSYTPLPPMKPYDPDDPEAIALRLMIREEKQGEMSTYLHRLNVGAAVELRGPKLECQIPNDVDDIVFFAGGTGIAPALQVAHYIGTIVPGSGHMPRMHIIWSNRRREDCQGGIDDFPKSTKPPKMLGNVFGGLVSAGLTTSSTPKQSPIVRELELLKSRYQGRLRVDYFVDEEKDVVDKSTIQQYLAEPQPEPGEELSRKLVFIAGPDGFVDYMAGPKEWRDGKEQQGPLGGLLKSEILPHWTVIKL